MSRPLVLLHGLWDTPRLFRRLEEELLRRSPQLEMFAPTFPIGLARCRSVSLPPGWLT